MRATIGRALCLPDSVTQVKPMALFTSENQPLKRGRTGRQRGLMMRTSDASIAIPRAFPDHRTWKGTCYARYCRATIERLGPLAPDTMVLLRECGRIVVDLEAVAQELEKARGPALRRARRRQIILRTQLGRLEDRLLALASAKPALDIAQQFALAHKEAGNGPQ
jgi:hypothetical protein